MMLTGIPTRIGRLLGIVLVCVAVAAGSVLKAESKPAPPQESEESFPDMPTFNIFADEEIQRDFFRMQFSKPAGRPDLGFLLAIPKTWEETPLTVSIDQLKHDDENMISLALLHGSEEEVQIEIAYCRVPETIDIEQWASAYLEGNSLEVLHVQTGEFSGRKVYDTLLKAPGEYKVRMTFSRHGDKIYIVSGSAPASLYDKYMKIFGLAVVSFRKL